MPEDNCSSDHLQRYLRSLPSDPTRLALSSPCSDVKATFSSDAGVPKIESSATGQEQPRPTQSASAGLNPVTSPLVTIGIAPHELPRKPDPDVKLNRAKSDVSVTHFSTGEDLMQKLADLLSQRQDRDSLLPRPEPEVFTGNPLRYPSWIKSFETFIERKTRILSERLYYLSKYTTGEARQGSS